MLSWFFKKRGEARVPPPLAAEAQTAPGPATRPSAKAPAPPVDGAAWADRVQAAQGDDAALLRIAQTAPLLAIKVAAVEAITTEAVLRLAEREFRGHDRKVHRLAKQRLDTAVAQREARAQAQLLVERLVALLGADPLAINHVVELDRDWQALAQGALSAEQLERYAELRARLDDSIREQGAEQQRLRRWTIQTNRALLDWQRGITAAAVQGCSGDVAAWTEPLGALRLSRPDVEATAALDLALGAALAASAAVAKRLAWLEAMASATDAVIVAELATAPDDPIAPAARSDWKDLAPLPDAELARILDQRHQQWLRARPIAQAVAAEPATAVRPPRSADADVSSAEQRLALEDLLQQAEAALAEGQVGAMVRHLELVDAAVATGSALPPRLRARHHALQAEAIRLHGWRQWGGARAREDLVAQAQALAQLTLAATTPMEAEPAAPSDAPAPRDRPKLNLKEHGQRIQDLRLRWKELDRLGAAAPQALWLRFDAALQQAHQPLAAQQAVVKAARQDNLAARQALLDALEGVPLPDAAAATTDGMPDWRPVQRELNNFRLAWRKLGPAEHTVPSAARAALQQRLDALVARLQQPLQEAEQQAVAQREELITQAQALLPALRRDLPLHEATRQVRELQAGWQEQARRLPLPRPQEVDLWARFKAATDAVFAERAAASTALDADRAAQRALREKQLERLSALDADSTVTTLERTLAEVDRAWRAAGEGPRGVGDALETRFRAARAAASQLLETAARRHWQAQCEALAGALALCEQDEDSVAVAVATQTPWTAPAALPTAWQQALVLRRSRAPAPGPLPERDFDDLLLQLETALNLPITSERQDERRELKLRALKAAMEGRARPEKGPARQAEWWLATLRQSGLNLVQRARLRDLVAALSSAAPGALGLPQARR